MDDTQIKPPIDPDLEFENFELNPTHLKQEINNLLWKWLPGNTTLEFAEKLAIRWFDVIQALHEKDKNR